MTAKELFTQPEDMIMQSKSIQDIHHIRDFLPRVRFNSLILWDLDNTLIRSTHELGSDSWFTHMMTHVIQKTKNDPRACRMAIDIYNHVQHHTKTTCTEPDIIKIIHRLRIIGIPQLIITARGKELKDTTLSQLKDNFLDFSAKEIIFCSGQNKGECLEQVLKKRQMRPKHILMIDDKKSHLEHIKETASKFGIAYHGFHYRYLEPLLAGFNMHAACYQLSLLHPSLPVKIQEHIIKLALIPSPVQQIHPLGLFSDTKADAIPEVSETSATPKPQNHS
jgi:hypothetical protein